MITGKHRENIAGAVAICFDTNIYINLAKGTSATFLDQLKMKIDAGECILLVNEIIIAEWEHNKAATVNSVTSSILNESKAARKIAGFVEDPKQKEDFLNIVDQYLTSEETRLAKANAQVLLVEDLLLKYSVRTEVTDDMRLQAVKMALEKKAPFIRKSNSVGTL